MKVFTTTRDYTCTVCAAKAVSESNIPIADGGRSNPPQPDLGRIFHFTIRAPVGYPQVARVKNYPDDLRQVQSALNRFSEKDGGPAQKLKVDGIYGPRTQGAINKLQQKYGLFPKGWKSPDGVVDVEGGTIDQLRAGPPSDPEGVPLVVQVLPKVFEVITAARATVAAATKHALLPAQPSHLRGLDFIGGAALAKVDRTFKNMKSKTLSMELRQIDRLFERMAMAMGLTPDGFLFFEDELTSQDLGAIAYTKGGGFNNTKRTKFKKDDLIEMPNGQLIYGGVIYLCPNFRQVPNLSQAYVVIHELAHFVGPEMEPVIDDHGYFHKERKKYESLSTFHALHNADSYAQFAFDCIGLPRFDVWKGTSVI